MHIKRFNSQANNSFHNNGTESIDFCDLREQNISTHCRTNPVNVIHLFSSGVGSSRVGRAGVKMEAMLVG